MRAFLHLLRNEIRSLVIAPSTYIASVLALLLMGFLYMLTLVTVSSGEQDLAPPTIFFSLFWLPTLLVVPMLTMRSFAEERRLGTLETLMTAPVRPAQIVLAKFSAAYLFYALIWLISLAYPLLATLVLGSPLSESVLLSLAPTVGGLLFVFLSGALFVAIGIFSSSLTRSQLVAGMLSFSAIFMLIVGVAAVRLLQIEMGVMDILNESIFAYFQIFQHFDDFSNGIIDSRPFAYYLSGTTLVLALATLFIDSRS